MEPNFSLKVVMTLGMSSKNLLSVEIKSYGVEINKVTSKYKDLDFNDTNKDKFLEDLNLISEGVKAAVD